MCIRDRLDAEHAIMYRLRASLRSLPIQIHGCVNDCFLVTMKRKHRDDRRVLNTIIQQNVTWPGGVQTFRVSEADHQAPLVEWSYPVVKPVPSSYRENKGPTSRAAGAYGAWLSNVPDVDAWEWTWLTEEGEVDDLYWAQEVMAHEIVKNRGAYVDGRGGTGKSKMVTKYLIPQFKAKGYEVHCIAFTHVAAGNLDGNTIQHELHRWMRGNNRVIIVDESSMVPLSMWAALANLKFTGNHIVVLGDMDGQFLPIGDQDQEYKLEGLDESRFMYDLCNGLHLSLIHISEPTRPY